MRRSAERMKSPVLDLIQIHNLLDWRTHLATLRDMKAKGQVRYIGITHYTTGALPELGRILDSEPGIGSTFTVYLPHAEGGRLAAANELRPAQPLLDARAA